MPRSCLILSLLSILVTLAAERPNIIILYADDMGGADVSLGNPQAKIQTPNIDRIAASGMTFPDGHSSSGICTPSRYALLTGQHHWRRFHGICRDFGPSVFGEQEFTMARMLQRAGYATGCFGKWHLGWDWGSIMKPGTQHKDPRAEAYDWSKPFKGGPTDQGFDYYFGDGTINFPPYCWIENDRILSPPVKPVMKSQPLAGGGTFRKGPMAEDWNPYDVLPKVTAKAVEWIEQQEHSQPFFAYLAFNSPHYPIVPNKEFHGTSQAGYYGDFIVETDAMVGRILEALNRKDMRENTIIVFTADNGAETLAYDRLEQFGHWSSGAYRGVKHDLYEGGHRVPFIVSWPHVITPGSISHEVINQVDLTATFAAVAGQRLKESEAIDSYDFLPVWKGQDYERPLRVATVQNTYEDNYALRQGDWVFINDHTGTTRKQPQSYLEHFQITTFPQKTTPGLLFNLRDDPRQSTNLYAQYPEKVHAMKALLNDYLSGTPCAPR